MTNNNYPEGSVPWLLGEIKADIGNIKIDISDIKDVTGEIKPLIVRVDKLEDDSKAPKTRFLNRPRATIIVSLISAGALIFSIILKVILA